MSVDSNVVRRLVVTMELTSSDPGGRQVEFAELRHSNADPDFVNVSICDGELGKLNREQAAMLAGALSVFVDNGCFPDGST